MTTELGNALFWARQHVRQYGPAAGQLMNIFLNIEEGLPSDLSDRMAVAEIQTCIRHMQQVICIFDAKIIGIATGLKVKQ